MSKFYALKGKDVFDINKVTVVGSPTITSDGVASGFSNSNYLVTSNFSIANISKLEINFKYTYSSTQNTSGSTTQLLWQMRNSWRVEVNPTSIRVNGFTNRPEVRINLIDGDIIEGRVVITLNTVTLDIYINKIHYSNTVSNSDISFTTTPQYINISNPASTYYWTGSIDLPSFKIYVDNQLVFQPVKPAYLLERRKEGYDPSKFTVVGSPTITADGVASGFSSENYIGFINGLNSLTKPFKISCTFKTNFSSTSVPQPLWTMIDNSFTSNSARLIISMEKKLVFQMYVSGTNQKTSDSSILLDNTWYKAICWQDNDGSMHLKYHPLGHEELVEIKVLDTANLVNIQNVTTAVFGKSIHNIGEIYLGQTDLSQFSITVDGKEVFTGAKENYYMLRR